MNWTWGVEFIEIDPVVVGTETFDNVLDPEERQKLIEETAPRQIAPEGSSWLRDPVALSHSKRQARALRRRLRLVLGRRETSPSPRRSCGGSRERWATR